MKLVFVILVLAVGCVGYHLGRYQERWYGRPYFKSDLILKHGVQGKFGEKETREFPFKEGVYKIPDEYELQYDSIQLLISSNDVIVSLCYPNKKPDWKFKYDSMFNEIHPSKDPLANAINKATYGGGGRISIPAGVYKIKNP